MMQKLYKHFDAHCGHMEYSYKASCARPG